MIERVLSRSVKPVIAQNFDQRNRFRICFVVSEDWYFCSHRLPLAEAALQKGWEVLLISRHSGCEVTLTEQGIRTVHLDLERGSLNPLPDLKYCWKLAKIYSEEKPDIVHHVAMKPCLYGSIAAWWSNTGCVVNAGAGFGTLFSSKSIKVKIVRPFVLLAFRYLFNCSNSKLILQNIDDVNEMQQNLKLQRERLELIRGSGVNLAEFCPINNKSANESVLIVMVSRLLTDKGVLELIEAGRDLKSRGIEFKIALVGDADVHNAHAVPDSVLREAESEGLVELWGRMSDIASIYQHADVAVLPSYREGLPKSLIEAAACGLPIVTTDVPGCREVVDDGINGFLVPARKSLALADALQKLVEDPELRSQMGHASRKKAEREFGIEMVVSKTFAVYNALLKSRKPMNEDNTEINIP